MELAAIQRLEKKAPAQFVAGGGVQNPQEKN